MQIEKQVINVASGYYINLPYHNFKHALKVMKYARQLIKRYRKKIDEIAICHATLFHDAGYHQNHKRLGFQTKEHLSAAIAEKELRKLGYAKQHIAKVKKLILITRKETRARTPEEKIVRASDLEGIKGKYKDFVNENKLLRKEFNLLTGKKVSHKQWKKMTKEILSHYLTQKIKLTPYYYDAKGRSLFHERAWRNVQRFISE